MAQPQKAAGRPAHPEARRDLLLTGLLFAAALLAYLPALNGGRLLDDDLHITPPSLQSLAGLGRIWFDVGATQQYYPVLHTAFWIEHLIWGGALAGYHLVNVLLHALSARLVVVLMRRLRLPGGWLAAFVFALHPVCVESVAWIAEQKNTLSTAFALGSAIAYLDFDEDRGRPGYLRAIGFFALALLSKTAVVTVPAALLVLVWWRRSRLEWRRDVAPLLPWFVLAGLMSLVTSLVESGLLAGVDSEYTLSLPGRIVLSGRILWFYLGTLLWPSGLTFFYPRWIVDASDPLQLLFPAAAAALGIALLLRARRSRGPLAAFLCFAGLLLPVLGFVNLEWFVFSYVADHLQYQACLAVIVPLSAGLASASAGLPSAARFGPAGAAALAALLGILTWRQCARYADPVEFYRTAAALNPGSAAAYDNLGAVLSAIPGRLDDAVEAYRNALRINPNAPQGNEDLATVLLKDPSRWDEAAARLEIALRFRPNRKLIRDKLALALSGLPGRLPDAIAQYQASIRIDPTDPAIHNRLGLALSKTPGRLPDAIAEYREAIRLDPGFAEAHNNLGYALSRTPGGLDQAVSEITEALRLDPGFAEAHNNLGLALAEAGRLGDAIGQFREAIRLEPGLESAHLNLGLAWTLVPGRTSDAIAELREAVRLNPDDPGARRALAAVLRQSGQTP
jgi:tetratricopeptide (TPR) repeat protein